MKKTCKKIAVFTLSLALIAGNAGYFLPNNIALTAKAASVTASEVQGKDESYYDAETETLHLKGYVRNAADGSGLIFPDGVKKKDIVGLVADEGTVFPADCSHLFQSFGSKLWIVDLHNADTSNVTDMSYMFYCPEKDGRSLYYNFDISTFDTSKVTNMEGMFMGCSGIFNDGYGEHDNFASFDTSNVTNMSRMFKDAGLAIEDVYNYWDIKNDKITFPSFDTSKVTDMSEMFAEANILALNLTNFDTSNVTTMSRMFEGNWHLIKLDISTFDTSNVTDMSCMFNRTYNWAHGAGLGHVDMSSFNTSKVTDMSYMFAETCIDSLDLSSFDTSNVTDMCEMFSGSRYLSYANMQSFDTRNVKNMSYMFSSTGFDKIDIRNFVISDDTKIDGMFSIGTKYGRERDIILPYGWTKEKMLEKDEYIFWAGDYDTNALEAPDESYYDAKTKTLHLKGFIRNSADGSGIILPDGVDKNEIEAIVAEKGTVLPPNSSYLFSFIPLVETIDLKNADTSYVNDMSWMFAECDFLTSLDLSNFDTSNVKSMKAMFTFSRSIKELDLSSFDTSNVTSFDFTFHAMFSLEHLDLSSFDTSKATDMQYMFYYCHDLKSLDVSHFNTSNVTHMSYMFCGCESLSSLDVSNFDTSNVKDMSSLFSYCKSLKTLDLSSFDISQVSGTTEMFNNCTSLKTIYVNDKWEPSSVYSYMQLSFPPNVHRVGLDDDTDMFGDCINLVGGAGTVYDRNYTGIEYARIDGGTEDPGYLTLKSDKKCQIMTHNLVLSGKIGVSFNLDLSSFTDAEKTASYMEFSINGRTSKAYFDKNSKSPSGKYYSFICYITSVEMADNITAVFHFGNNETITEKYSVYDYICKINENSSNYDQVALDLIHSIADYGYHVQPFLAAYNNWTLGKEHKAMNQYYTSAYSYDIIKKNLSAHKRITELGTSDIEKFTCSLALDTDTSLNVFIKPKDNYNGSVNIVTKKGSAATSYKAVKQADGRYKVTIPNIPAHQLGDQYLITAVTDNGTATCKLSALSYAYAVLDGSSFDEIAKDAVSALCEYYEAAVNYRKNS